GARVRKVLVVEDEAAAGPAAHVHRRNALLGHALLLFVCASTPPASRISRSRGVSTHVVAKLSPVRVFVTVIDVPATSEARSVSMRSTSSRSIVSYAAGSANVSGATPQLIRFARWIRANDFTITART